MNEDEEGRDNVNVVIVEDEGENEAAEVAATEEVAEEVSISTTILEKILACLERLETSSTMNQSTQTQSTVAENTLAEATAAAIVLTAEAKAKQTNAETKVMLEQAETLERAEEEAMQGSNEALEVVEHAPRTTWI